MEITFSRTIDGVDWSVLTQALKADDFDNGRTPDQLCRSFENSQSICFAWCDGQVIGKARALSDGIGNAYILDVWTLTLYRKRGIATAMLRLIFADLPGQHVYLQADDNLIGFYSRLGFQPQPNGLSRIIGRYLDPTSEEDIASGGRPNG